MSKTGRKWPKRVRGAASYRSHAPGISVYVAPTSMESAGYTYDDRVVIISAAELRYLDVCRRHFEAMRKASATKGERP